MRCVYCKNMCVKKGKYRTIQRYQCKHCKRYQQKHYSKFVIPSYKYDWVLKLNNECCGIRSIGRLLKIAKTSVQRVIERIAEKIQRPVYKEENQSYEVDELRTYCGNKKNESWIIYAINKVTGKVIDFVIGRRTKLNTEQVINSVLKLNPKRIYTDGLNSYLSLIPKDKHKVFQYCTNKIERHNLTMRTHLKRLVRKTICFTKNDEMLENCMKLYCFI